MDTLSLHVVVNYYILQLPPKCTHPDVLTPIKIEDTKEVNVDMVHMDIFILKSSMMIYFILYHCMCNLVKSMTIKNMHIKIISFPYF